MNKLTIVIGMLTLTIGLSTPISSQNIIINEQPEVTRMMNSFISKNRSQESIRGWRIQIITTDDRRKMEKDKARFSNLYPEIPQKWSHESPYYKVQIGAYEDKMSLQGFLLELKSSFPTAIPVRDDVKKTELVAY